VKHRRPLVVAAIVLALVAGYSAWAISSPYRLDTAIEIDATPQEVWTVLTDLPAYGQWNPFIVSSTGELRPGGTLTNTMRDATGETTFTPTVLTAEADRELRWVGKLGPGGVFDGEHRFVIERLGPNRVRLTQSERFTGVLVPFARGQLHDNTLPQFHAMNKALAERVAAVR
jgi:hypothetical protein